MEGNLGFWEGNSAKTKDKDEKFCFTKVEALHPLPPCRLLIREVPHAHNRARNSNRQQLAQSRQQSIIRSLSCCII